MRDHPFLAPNTDFHPFGLSHGVSLALFVVATVLVVRWGKRAGATKRYRIGLGLALATLGCWLAGFTGRLALGDWQLDADLPLNLCPISAFLLVYAVGRRDTALFEVLYFWVLAACAQALVTPELREAFPHYMFWRFWVLHAGLVMTVLYAVAVLGWRPRAIGILRAFGWGVVYLAGVAVVNIDDAAWGSLPRVAFTLAVADAADEVARERPEERVAARPGVAGVVGGERDPRDRDRDHEVDALVLHELLDRRVRGDALHERGRGVDRVDGPLKPAGEQVGQRALRRKTKHYTGYTCRCKQTCAQGAHSIELQQHQRHCKENDKYNRDAPDKL